ncbi:MAG TPA: D-alanine--D-alanine ligase family protein [Candidatus Sabulitectum sp.]|nr:D-alanine--D-alanine ligase family protein [Candidatus Sabulitectum sp.]HPJ27689.1 D-alanine--D-alanine ligase family protein [Candidatus Sabulitectum sp.]HPR22805.1 D-alanine--D-alanine ligase family protein [Candidatus Sabulitectum sp.]
MRVLVLSGGRSPEHDISRISAKWVSGQLRDAGHQVTDAVIDGGGRWFLEDSPDHLTMDTGPVPWSLSSGGAPVAFDAVFPVLHGSYGEDGTVQGLCATAGWPCAGVGVLGSALAMEKHTMKTLASSAGIPVAPWVLLDEDPAACYDCLKDSIQSLGYPLFVKPSRLGSSVGISRVDTPDELPVALGRAAEYDSRILVEKAVERAREIEVSVMGNGVEVLSSIPGEVIPGREWYDFKAKYHCRESRLSIPAVLEASEAEDMRMMAESAFRLLGGRGFARVDFLMNHQGIFFNEVNTIPGFTEISMFPKLWEASGLDSGEVLNYILQEAVNRGEQGLLKEMEKE